MTLKDYHKIKTFYTIILYAGKRVPVKCETKQERNETDRNETNRNETEQIETKQNKSKRNETKQMIWQAIVDNYRYFLI